MRENDAERENKMKSEKYNKSQFKYEHPVCKKQMRQKVRSLLKKRGMTNKLISKPKTSLDRVINIDKKKVNKCGNLFFKSVTNAAVYKNNCYVDNMADKRQPETKV